MVAKIIVASLRSAQCKTALAQPIQRTPQQECPGKEVSGQRGAAWVRIGELLHVGPTTVTRLQDQAKGSYYEAKDVTAGATHGAVDDTKDAAGSAADSVNQGAAHAQQVRRQRDPADAHDMLHNVFFAGFCVCVEPCQG